MKLIGLIRIRNEAEIINDTLNHMAEFCDEVYVYDDASTDNTVEICKAHSIVKGIVCGTSWDTNRERAEYENRQKVFLYARNNANLNGDDWFIYMDADERIDFDFSLFKKDLHNNVDGIVMRLFDFYITEEDKDKHYTERQWLGPEYRDILFMFKNKNAIGYQIPDQRECFLTPNSRIILSGYVKHYGKSISIQQWEDTCEYYATNFPKYADKWNNRRGKAIHDKSDFGRNLIKWNEKNNQKVIVAI